MGSGRSLQAESAPFAGCGPPKQSSCTTSGAPQPEAAPGSTVAERLPPAAPSPAPAAQQAWSSPVPASLAGVSGCSQHWLEIPPSAEMTTRPRSSSLAQELPSSALNICALHLTRVRRLQCFSRGARAALPGRKTHALAVARRDWTSPCQWRDEACDDGVGAVRCTGANACNHLRAHLRRLVAVLLTIAPTGTRLRCPVCWCRCQVVVQALAPSAAGCLQLADLLKLQLAKLEADPEKASDSNVPNDELVGDVGCEHP